MKRSDYTKWPTTNLAITKWGRAKCRSLPSLASDPLQRFSGEFLLLCWMLWLTQLQRAAQRLCITERRYILWRVEKGLWKDVYPTITFAKKEETSPYLPRLICYDLGYIEVAVTWEVGPCARHWTLSFYHWAASTLHGQSLWRKVVTSPSSLTF